MKKVVAFYGTILLKLDDLLGNNLVELWHQGENLTDGFYDPYYDEILKLQNSIFDLLNEKPNVKNVRSFKSLSKEHFDPVENYMEPDEEYLMRFSSPIMFDVDLPLDERVYEMSINENENYVQEYSVIYNGSVFLAYTYIDDEFSDGIGIGPEIRESLKKVLSSTIWEAKIMPPCPIRMQFFLQSFEDANNEEFFSEDLGLIYDEMTYEDISEVEEIMMDLYFKNELEIEWFCSLMSLKHKSERLTWKISEAFEEIQEKFKIMSKNRYSKQKNTDLRKAIFEIYQKLYEYDKTLFQYNSKKESLINALDNFNSPYIKEYILSELPIREFNQSNILNSLSYIEDRISENRTVSSSIIAAVIGAVAGFLTSAGIPILNKIISIVKNLL